MKKIVFAFQVFGLIAISPVYVILEINHGTGRLPEINSLSKITGKIVKTGIEQSTNAKSKNKDDIFYLTQKLFLNTEF